LSRYFVQFIRRFDRAHVAYDDVIRAHPDDYDPDFEAIFHRLVDRLDPSAAT
jgi:hypothetical protein